MTTFVDYPEDFTTATVPFTTHDSNGAPVAPSTALEAADIVIWKNGNAAEKTTTNGLTMTSPFDSKTGLHMLTIDLSNDTGDASFWVAGAIYDVYLSPDETVNGQVVGELIGKFGIELANVVRPTTAGRKLDVSADGEAGVDWANVGSPTTVVNLSGTTVKTATDVETDTADIQTRLPAALVSGRIDASVGAMAANVMTAAAAAADLTTELQSGLATAAALAAAAAFIDTEVADIKTKTDNLPSDPADASVVASLIAALEAKIDIIDTTADAILLDTAEIGAAGAGLTNINLPNQTMDIVGNITGDLSGSVGSVTTLDTAAIVTAINNGLHDNLSFTTILQKLSALLLRDAVNLTTDVRGYKNGAGDIVMEVTFTDLGDTRTTNLSP